MKNLFHKQLRPAHVLCMGSLFLLCIFLLTQCNNTQILTTDTSTTQTATAQYAGAIQGSFSVSNDGGNSYGISIDVPPGTRKVQPKLSFAYNSKGGNGMMGLGWDVQGLPTIQRQAATVAQDGFSGSINYDDNDRFALNGQRLIKVQENPDGSVEYHTETESWAKVIAYYATDSCGGGPCWFQVMTKRGYVVEYGNTEDSRIEAQGKEAVRVWAVNKISDLNGNYLTVTYDEDTNYGAYYPSQIDYTGNDAVSPALSTQRQIKFNYTDTRQDTVPAYLGGSLIQYNKLLESIQTYLSDDLITQYNLYYSYSMTTYRSLLDSISQCDVNNKCLPAMEFTWQEGNNNYVKQSILNTANIPQDINNVATPMDINGDGLYDLINYWVDESTDYLNYSVFTSDGEQLQETEGVISTSVPTTAIYPSMYSGDINGDGQIDLACSSQASDETLSLASLLAHSDEFDITESDISQIDVYTNGNPFLVAGDYNGDGLNDLVFPYQNSSQDLGLKILLSNGSTFDLSTDTSYSGLTSYSNTSFYLFSANINGDAMSDLLYAYNGSSGSVNIGVLIATGNGFDLVNTIETSMPTVESQNYLPMDINGDSFTDLAITWYDNSQTNMQVLVSNGQTLTPANTDIEFPTFSAVSATMYPMEINGDGMSDIMYVYPDENNNLQFQPYLSNGTNFVISDNLLDTDLQWSNTPYTILAMDINGDAKTDLLYLSPDDSSGTNLTPIMANTAYPDLMSEVKNGIGGSISIDYLPMTNDTIYTEDTTNIENGLAHFSKHNGSSFFAGNGSMNTGNNSIGQAGTAYPIVNADMPTYMVSAYTKDDGNGNSYDYSYHYSGAKNDMNGRGWMGFQSKSLTDYSMGTVSTSFYKQLFPFTGTVDSSMVRTLSDNQLMTKNILTYQDSISVVNGGQDTLYIVNKKESITNYYDYGEFAYSLKKTFEYDEFGNNILTIDYGTTDKILYKFNRYENDTADWQLGYITESKATSDAAGNNLLAHKKLSYDTLSRNIQKKHVWFDQGGMWVDTSYVYDAYGNAIQIIDPSNDTTEYVFEDTYYTFMTQQISPPNQDGLKLVSQYDYLPQFGQVNKMIDPNENGLSIQYDGLGRVTTVQMTSPSNDLQTVGEISYHLGEDVGYYQQKRMILDWDSSKVSSSNTYYDGLLRNYRNSSLADNNQTVFTDQWVNSDSKVVKKTVPYFEGDSPRYMRFDYDPYGRIDRVSRPLENGDSTVVITEYQGKTFTLKAAEGTSDSTHTIVHYEYYNSQKSHTKKISQASYNACQSVNTYDTTYFEYDLLGRVTQSLDPSKTPTNITYNSLSQKMRFENESMGSTEYLFDIPNRTYQSVSASSDTIIYVMDALDRLISKTLPDGSQVLFNYDLSNHKNSLGQVSTITMPHIDQQMVKYSYTYDNQGNANNLQFTIGGQQYNQSRNYNPDQSVESMTYPDSSALSLDYTLDGLASIHLNDSQTETEENNQFLQINQYDAAGKVLDAMYGNGVQANFSYTPMGQLNTYQLIGADSTLLSHQYSRNYVSQIDTIFDLLNSDYSQFFEYDIAGRLKTAQGIYGDKSYCHDARCNMILKDDITYSYDNYQVIKGTDNNGNTTFAAQYDVNGNMTQRQDDTDSTAYTYDFEDRLLTVTKNDTLLYEFAYDYTGKRILKIDAINHTKTLYISSQYEITEYAQDSTLYTKYIPGSNGNIASVTHAVYHTMENEASSGTQVGTPTTGTLYFHQDHVSSTKLTTNSNGHLSTQMFYMPFGEVYEKATYGPNNFRAKFGGKELDEESDLYYFSARYYDPKIARFITSDDQLGGNVFQNDAFNTYAYTLNNPIRYADPSGHSVVSGLLMTASILVDAALAVGEVVVDVVTLGLATPAEAALDAAVVGGEAAVEVGVDAMVDVAADGVEDAAADAAEDAGEDLASNSESMGAGDEGGMDGASSDNNDLDAKNENCDNCNCFTAGTPVSTEDGTKPIEDVQVGDKVWAYNEKTGENQLSKVVQLFNNTVPTLYLLRINEEVIETTPEHPFWVNGKWVKAENLKVGDILRGKEGEQVIIDNIEVERGKYEVFNFEVEGVHNYYVSKSKVLAHNVCSKEEYEQSRGRALDGTYTQNDLQNIKGFLKDGYNSVKPERHGLSRDQFNTIDNLYKNQGSKKKFAESISDKLGRLYKKFNDDPRLTNDYISVREANKAAQTVNTLKEALP